MARPPGRQKRTFSSDRIFNRLQQPTFLFDQVHMVGAGAGGSEAMETTRADWLVMSFYRCITASVLLIFSKRRNSSSC